MVMALGIMEKCVCLCLLIVINFGVFSSSLKRPESYSYHVGSPSSLSSSHVNEFVGLEGGEESVHLLSRRDTVSGGDSSENDKDQSTKKPMHTIVKNASESENASVKTTVKGGVDVSSTVSYTTDSNVTNSEGAANKTQVDDLDKNRTSSNSTSNSTTTSKPVLPTPETSTPSEESKEDDLPGFPEKLTNVTLHEHNITTEQVDHHEYYNSSFIVNPAVGRSYWMNLTAENSTMHDMLSQSHRRAATVKLTFDFPFYGHIVRNITIATGGFLYTGDYVHSWLAATQYIAPLMANFDTSLHNDSHIKYLDNGTAFIVQWDTVIVQEKPEAGNFTFQVTLHNNGDIVFVYQNVPFVIREMTDEVHPVKVGLSDAYIVDRTIFFVRRKTIYEYHRVDFKKEDIKNWTVIYLKALPTCLDMKDCSSCVSGSIGFECVWCPGVDRCSNGMDRHRQDWLLNGCDRKRVKNNQQCEDLNPKASPSLPTGEPFADDANHSASTQSAQSVSMGMSGILTILFVVALIGGLGVWLFYAYRNPHTASGQFLIKYRPSQWAWKRGEARYTAATIHM